MSDRAPPPDGWHLVDAPTYIEEGGWTMSRGDLVHLVDGVPESDGERPALVTAQGSRYWVFRRGKGGDVESYRRESFNGDRWTTTDRSRRDDVDEERFASCVAAASAEARAKGEWSSVWSMPPPSAFRFEPPPPDWLCRRVSQLYWGWED